MLEPSAPSFSSATISAHDRAAIASVMGHLPRPTLILMNPPFSRSLGRGADQNAAARHLQAAISWVAPGGRGFTKSARLNTVCETVLRDTTVQTSLRIERCYEKHGTSIAVRLYVQITTDKAPFRSRVIDKTGS